MSFIASNLRYLRKHLNYTQSELASKLGVNRSVIGAYEEGRAEPKLKTLIALANYFDISLDAIITNDLSKANQKSKSFEGNHDLRILPITVDRSTEKELIPLVPVKASAGYANGYGDVDFISQLPRFQLPFPEMKDERSYRIFQIDGDSMEPIPSGSYVLSEYVEDWSNMRDYRCHILVTQDDGVVYKRTVNNLQSNGRLELISDNPAYAPYSVEATEIREVWKALGYVSFALPDGRGTERTPQLDDLATIVAKLQQEVEEMKSVMSPKSKKKKRGK